MADLYRLPGLDVDLLLYRHVRSALYWQSVEHRRDDLVNTSDTLVFDRNANGTTHSLSIWFVSLMVCAIMPSTTTAGYASHEFIWQEWNNQSGYSSNGFV